jgi:hypothetical protein
MSWGVAGRLRQVASRHLAPDSHASFVNAGNV